MARLRRKPTRLAVRILCLNYLAQKRSERAREREREQQRVKGRKESANAPLRSHPTSKDSVGRLNVAKVLLPVKERAVVFFDEPVAGLKSGMRRENGMKRAARQTRKSEVRLPGAIPLSYISALFFNVHNFLREFFSNHTYDKVNPPRYYRIFITQVMSFCHFIQCTYLICAMLIYKFKIICLFDLSKM